MKKIGLAVCHEARNFGSQLQILATVRKIEEYGFAAEIIQYKKALTPIFILQTIPRLLNPRFMKAKIARCLKNNKYDKYPEIENKCKYRNKRFAEFRKKYFSTFSPVYSGWETLVRESAKNYDAFLCGSDQLWLPQNIGSHFYTLEFAPKDKPKIAYATSFGVDSIPYYQHWTTARFLKRFQSLSTREIAGQKIIQKLTGRESAVVCDPTLLFDADGWNNLIPQRGIVKEPYIFCYFLGTNPEHRDAARLLSKETGLKIVTIPFLDNFVEADLAFGDEAFFDVDATDFVNLIRNADYILTDSFHGSVFSIINHKRFITFDRFVAGKNSRNSRIDSLCSILGLSERRYRGDISFIHKEIQYDVVDQRLATFRNKSIEFLKNALLKINE